MKELKKLVINGVEYVVKDSGAVAFDKDQTLTEEQKTNARKNINAAKTDRYALIETITMAEEAQLDRSAEPDGTPYNLEAVFFHILVPAGVAMPSGSVFFYGKGKSTYFTYRWTASASAGEDPLAFHGRVYRDKGIWCWHIPGEFRKYNSSPQLLDTTRTDIGDIVNEDLIGRIYFNHKFPAGTVIQIYGVRA